MKIALTACGLVAACALAVLALDLPAAAAPPPERRNCCAFPDRDHADASGFTVRLPVGWQARGDGHGGIVVDGDREQQLWIVPLPAGTPADDAAARHLLRGVMARAAPGRRVELHAFGPDGLRATVPDDRPDWLGAVLTPRPDGGATLYLFRARRDDVASLARRFDAVLRSARDAQGGSLAAPFDFDALTR